MMDHQQQQDLSHVLVQWLPDGQSENEVDRPGLQNNQEIIPFININPSSNQEDGLPVNQGNSPFRNQSDDLILNPEDVTVQHHILFKKDIAFLDKEDDLNRNQDSGPLEYKEITEDGQFLPQGGGPLTYQGNQGSGPFMKPGDGPQIYQRNCPHKMQYSGLFMNQEDGQQKYQENDAHKIQRSGPFMNPKDGPQQYQGNCPNKMYCSGPFMNPNGGQQKYQGNGPNKMQCSGPFMNLKDGPQQYQGICTNKMQCSGPSMNQEDGQQKYKENGAHKKQRSGPFMNPKDGPQQYQGNGQYKMQHRGPFMNPEGRPHKNHDSSPFMKPEIGPKSNQVNIPFSNQRACKMNDDNDDYQYAQHLQNEELQKNIQHAALNGASTIVGKHPEISENKDAQYAHKLQKLEVRQQKRVDRTMAERLANNKKLEQICTAATKEGNNDAWYLPYDSEEDYLVALQIQEQMNFEQQKQDLMLAQRLTDEQTKNEVERRRRDGPHRNRDNGSHRHRRNGQHRDGLFWNPRSGSNRNPGYGPHSYHPFWNPEANNSPLLEFNPFVEAADDDDEFVSATHGPSVMMSLMTRSPGMIVPETIDVDDYDSLWELAEQLGEVKNCGASHHEIGQLPVYQYKDSSKMSSESKECHICLTEFSEGETLRSLPCVHVYHKECIDKWLKKNAICPICRKSVKEG